MPSLISLPGVPSLKNMVVGTATAVLCQEKPLPTTDNGTTEIGKNLVTNGLINKSLFLTFLCGINNIIIV